MHLLVLATILVTGAPPVETGSVHYDIHSAGSAAVGTDRLLDCLYGQLSEYFEGVPNGPLQIALFSDRGHFCDALARDGQPMVKGGGYYAPENRTVYLFNQPSAYYTRHLLLHEATHQFHLLAATENRMPKTTWYVEGLADYFAMHNWDGRRLRCGVVPVVSLEDYPAAALKTIEKNIGHPTWLRHIIEGRETASRPLSWALIHFLVHRDREAFRRLGTQLDQNSKPLNAFHETTGPVNKEFTREFHRWVVDHQQPWSIVWTEWQQSGELLEGWSETVGLLVHKKPLARLGATIAPSDSQWKAGGVFGYSSESDHYLVQLSSDGEVRIVRRMGKRWQAVLSTTVAPETRSFTIERLGHQVTITVNGNCLHKQTAPGKLGLHVDGCRAWFRVSRVEVERGH